MNWQEWNVVVDRSCLNERSGVSTTFSCSKCDYQYILPGDQL